MKNYVITIIYVARTLCTINFVGLQADINIFLSEEMLLMYYIVMLKN